jgi:chromosome partitioning protein
MRRIAVINQKGGAGKTTLALALSVGLARGPGRRVLAVDADPQANLSLMLCDGEVPRPPTLKEVLLDEAAAIEAIRPTRIDRLHVLPSNGSLADCTALLAQETGREHRMRRALRSVEKKYSACVVDCSPGMSLVSINALKAVDELVVPVNLSMFGVHGIGKLRETVEQVQEYLEHPELTIIGLAIQCAMPNRQTKQLERDLRRAYGPLVYKTVIPYATSVEQAHCRYRCVLETAPRSAVAVVFERLIREIRHERAKRRARRAATADATRRPGRRRGKGGSAVLEEAV